jgi:cellulose synthase/poly-beta-1,6-N-acetylglucosamine synthase-like glycosyltransferase
VVFFDSDCIIPPAYFTLVTAHLKDHPLDAFGGPDMAAEHFNITQKAISYAMTSLFTTGGIRGSKKSVGPYQPRGFNMGIRRSVFNAVNGFSNLKVSEDIDLSIRLYEAGYKVGFIKEAAVYHKRRSTFYKFFRQVFSFGGGRIDLQFRHGNALKVVHTLPALFVFYIVAGLATLFISRALFSIWLASVLIYSIAILMDASCKNKSLRVGLLSIFASWLMLTGYGSGMIKTAWMRYVMKSTKESEKPEITRH